MLLLCEVLSLNGKPEDMEANVERQRQCSVRNYFLLLGIKKKE